MSSAKNATLLYWGCVSRMEEKMSLKNTVFLYLVALAIFFVIDMAWLGLVAKNFYRGQLGELLSHKVNWAAAILFYLLFIAGLQIFVIAPAVLGGGALQALWQGAFFGLVAYATYDLTNLATLRGWPLAVTVIDLVWGAFLGGTVSSGAALIGRWLFRG
jgi:uncharacterized membrane protein